MNRRALILFALCLAAFVISVDVTIVNVALPTLVRELGASTTQLQWIVDAYSLVFAALVLAAGSLSDRLGRKGVLLIGLALFATGSLAGAFSGTIGELIAANVRAKGWLIFYSHDVREQPSRFGVSPGLLEFSVAAAKSAGCRVVTIAAGLRAAMGGSENEPA